jgi:pimeloyl-ACP methyl ester carboxylesterase
VTSAAPAAVRVEELRVLGLRTRLLQAGGGRDDEAVVFVHGGPGSASDWDDLLPRIGSFGRAMAFDLPGFGDGDKPADHWGYNANGWANFIAAALSELGVARAHLVLHDLGGEAGLAWAAAHPGSFASAAMLNTGVLIDYRWHAIARLHRAPLVGRLAARTGGLGLRPVMRLYEPRLPKHVLERWRREFDWGTRRAMLRFYRTAPPVSAGRFARDLKRLDRPALVVWGARNRFVPVEQAERQRASFPSAEVIVLPGSGHYAHLHDPAGVAELVVPFVRRQLGQPAR